MKICHINLARGFSGGENQTLLLIKEQIRRGDEVSVVAKRGSPFAKACVELGITTHEVRHYLTGHRNSYTSYCDCMHVHEGQAVYWALLQHKYFKIPYIITRRIDNPFKNKWLSNLAYNNAARIIGVSKAVESIVAKQFPEVQTNVINDSPVTYNIDQNLLQALKSKYQNKFVVVQAAMLYQHKGFDVTISAAKHLQARQDIQFCLLGDGPELDTLKAQAEGLNNVEFLGLQREMGTWFERADLVILPSHTEGMGSVLLEATLAGVPVVGTRAGGIPDAIANEVNGLLVDVNDAASLAEAILRLKSDRALYEEIRLRAPSFIEGFSIEKAAQRYDKTYSEALAKPQ